MALMQIHTASTPRKMMMKLPASRVPGDIIRHALPECQLLANSTLTLLEATHALSGFVTTWSSSSVIRLCPGKNVVDIRFPEMLRSGMQI